MECRSEDPVGLAEFRNDAMHLKVPFNLLENYSGVCACLCSFIHYLYLFVSQFQNVLFSIIVEFPDCLCFTELICETDTADAPCKFG